MSKKYKRIVIKVGTSTLTDEKGMVDRAYLDSLVGQIADVKARGMDELLVTSGAIRAGTERMGLAERPQTMPEKQAAAAVGQNLLMQVYSEIFGHYGITTGQVLLTRDDFGDRRRYLNARNTMLTLFRHDVVPIVNENDTVAVDEIRVGDNDNLAALVAASLEADLLIVLSDVAGLYDTDPSKSPDAKVIPTVREIDGRIRSIAGGARDGSGTGGMRTKIEAAEIAMSCGVTMVVADGRQPNVIPDIVAGKQVGTTFLPKTEPLCGRKRWIAFGAPARGGIVVNDGAKKMICERGKSLLAVGVIGVKGDFGSGDMVNVLDGQGNQFARGFVNYSAGEVERIKGRRSSDIESILGYKDFDEVIHRDNMVLGA
ncbi:MAG TPA: glutamate 5-kinase [Armatimonadota bacterium]|nr:glutamate 5-kinase [Armatimonadota bacterium]